MAGWSPARRMGPDAPLTALPPPPSSHPNQILSLPGTLCFTRLTLSAASWPPRSASPRREVPVLLRKRVPQGHHRPMEMETLRGGPVPFPKAGSCFLCLHQGTGKRDLRRSKRMRQVSSPPLWHPSFGGLSCVWHGVCT